MKFQKGQSGNPKGRPRGSLNRATIARKVMGQTVAVVRDGRRKRISVHEAVLTRHANKALNEGDTRSAQLLLNEMRLADKSGEGTDPALQPLDEDDLGVVHTLIERIRRCGDEEGGGCGDKNHTC